MIIELLLDAIYAVMSLLTKPINLPSFPSSVTDIIQMSFQYLQAGVGILANYTDITYLLSLFGIILAIDVGIKLYHFVMWIIKKIPILGIE